MPPDFSHGSLTIYATVKRCDDACNFFGPRFANMFRRTHVVLMPNHANNTFSCQKQIMPTNLFGMILNKNGMKFVWHDLACFFLFGMMWYTTYIQPATTPTSNRCSIGGCVGGPASDGGWRLRHKIDYNRGWLTMLGICAVLPRCG